MPFTIEKLIYGGDGLARLPADDHGPGKAVFIPFVLPGEQVEAKITEQKPGFSAPNSNRSSSLRKIALRRLARTSPVAADVTTNTPPTTANWNSKPSILKENLKRIAKLELATELQIRPSPPWEYRNRARFQLRALPEFALGYYRFASHEILSIRPCPINSPLINRALSKLVEFGRTHPAPETVREIEFFAGTEDKQLLAELTCMRNADSKTSPTWSEELTERAAGSHRHRRLRAASPQRSTSGRRPDHGLRPFASIGDLSLTCKTASANFRVSAGAFFQVNRHMIDSLVEWSPAIEQEATPSTSTPEPACSHCQPRKFIPSHSGG